MYICNVITCINKNKPILQFLDDTCMIISKNPFKMQNVLEVFRHMFLFPFEET